MTGIGAVVAVLASAVIVLGGLVALTRAIWKVAQDIRDNRLATRDNTVALDKMRASVDARIGGLEMRVSALEKRR